MIPRTYPPRPDAAFTLIELLIVIAIIAILALIALPNFLEAQTRAKVARAQADMRSIATAVEAYAVDHNTYPLDADDRADFLANYPLSLAWYDQQAWYPVITTPIAYLTAAPVDPFHTETVPLAGIAEVLFPRDNPPYPYTYITPLPHSDPLGGASHGGKPSEYSIISLGPSQQFDSVDPRDALLYDPTNGTVSPGDIIRIGPGLQ